MAKRNPLAPGVYWIDIRRPSTFPTVVRDGDPVFQDWLSRSGASARVLQRDKASLPAGPVTLPFLVWYLFEVLPGPPPAAFPFQQLGWPTVQKLAAAPGGVTQADREVHAVDVVSTERGWFDDLADDFRNFVDTVHPGALLLGAVALYLWNQSRK